MKKEALLIGIGAYPLADGLDSLPGAAQDALALHQLLERRAFRCTRLLNGEATRRRIEQALDACARRLTRGDLLVVYCAAHLREDYRGQNLIAADADDRDLRPGGAGATLALSSIEAATGRSGCRRLIIADGWRAAGDSLGAGAERDLRALAVAAAGRAPLVLLSTASPGQRAEAVGELPRGLFVTALEAMAEQGLTLTLPEDTDRLREQMRLCAEARGEGERQVPWCLSNDAQMELLARGDSRDPDAAGGTVEELRALADAQALQIQELQGHRHALREELRDERQTQRRLEAESRVARKAFAKEILRQRLVADKLREKLAAAGPAASMPDREALQEAARLTIENRYLREKMTEHRDLQNEILRLREQLESLAEERSTGGAAQDGRVEALEIENAVLREKLDNLAGHLNARQRRHAHR